MCTGVLTNGNTYNSVCVFLFDQNFLCVRVKFNGEFFWPGQFCNMTPIWRVKLHLLRMPSYVGSLVAFCSLITMVVLKKSVPNYTFSHEMGSNNNFVEYLQVTHHSIGFFFHMMNMKHRM